MFTSLRSAYRLAGPAFAAILCLLPAVAIAQAIPPDSVTAPQLPGAELRARLAPTMARPGRPMPTDAAALDAMVTRKDWMALASRLRTARTAQDVELDMNWEQTALYNGGGILIAYLYVADLWRAGSSLPGRAGDQLKRTAGMTLLYALDLVRLDGAKCADVSTPGHRAEQLVVQNKAVLDYVHGLPRSDRMTLGTISLAIEAATASARTDDDVLCSGGLDELSAGLEAQGSRSLKQVPTPPGVAGKTYGVPRAPGYRTRFVAADVWQPKQVAIRQSMPAYLTDFLANPGEASVSPGGGARR